MPNEIGIKRTKEPSARALDTREGYVARYRQAVGLHIAHLIRGEYAKAEAMRREIEPLREAMEAAARRFNDRYPPA